MTFIAFKLDLEEDESFLYENSRESFNLLVIGIRYKSDSYFQLEDDKIKEDGDEDLVEVGNFPAVGFPYSG